MEAHRSSAACPRSHKKRKPEFEAVFPEVSFFILPLHEHHGLSCINVCVCAVKGIVFSKKEPKANGFYAIFA